MKTASAKIIAEELLAMHVSEDEGLPDEWRFTINGILSKVAAAILNAETRVINAENERLKKETAEAQTAFLEKHSVGNH